MTTIIDLPTNSNIFPTILSLLKGYQISNLQLTCNRFRYIVNSSITNLVFSDEDSIITRQDMTDRIAAFPNLDSVVIRLFKSIEFQAFRVLTRITKLSCSWLDFPQHTCYYLDNCINLKNLDLSYSKFSDEGMEPLSLLTNLTKLQLGYCNTITGGGFQYLTSLTNLLDLDVTGCNITDDGYGHIGRLTSLQCFQCIDCSNLHLIHLGNLTQLKVLYLQFSQQVIDISPIGGMSNLEYLNMDNFEHLTISEMNSWSTLDKLKRVDLYGSAVSNDILRCISQLPSLETLDVGDNMSFTSEGLGYLSIVTSLKGLYMSYCDCLTNDGLLYLSHLSQLTSLSISKCNSFDIRGLLDLTGLISLKELDITDCGNITRDHCEYIVTKMPTTNVLYGRTAFNDEDLEHFHLATEYW